MKQCSACRLEKPKTEFTRNRTKKDGLQHECKSYRRDAIKKWKSKNRAHVNSKQRERGRLDPRGDLLKGARARARTAGVPFDLSKDDIVIPDRCPILGIEIARSSSGQGHAASPTLDRIIPQLGYVIGNVAVISLLANTIKSSGSADVHRKIADWMDEQVGRVVLKCMSSSKSGGSAQPCLPIEGEP